MRSSSSAVKSAPPDLSESWRSPYLRPSSPQTAVASQPRIGRWLSGQVTEADPGRMGLDLVLRQTYNLTRREPDAVQPVPARVDAKVAPARVLRAQVEELARGMSVPVEVDAEGGLLSAGQGSREAAGAVQEIVQASGQLGVIGDLGSDLGAHVSAGRHEPATDTAAAAASIIVTTSSGCETIAT
jgi:hypothetical protein